MRFSVLLQLCGACPTSQARQVIPRGAVNPSRYVFTATSAAEGPQRLLIGEHTASCSCSSVRIRPANMHLVATPLRSLHTTSVGHPCPYSSRRGHLSSIEDAQKFLAALPIPQRMCLEKAVMEANKGVEPEVVTPPTWNQLKLCKWQKAVLLVASPEYC